MSLFGLWARRTWKRALAIFAGMAAVELGFFLWAALRSGDGRLLHIMETANPAIEGFLAFSLLTCVLAGIGPMGGTRPDYTLRRLSVPPRKVFLIRAAHNTLWYLVFWGVQLAVALGLCLLRQRLFPAIRGRQDVLLTFYRVPYLHALLPLGDWFLYVRNLLFFALMGCATAVDARRGLLYACVGLSLTFGIFFPAKMGLTGTVIAELTFLCLAACCAAAGVIGLRDEPGEEDAGDEAEA